MLFPLFQLHLSARYTVNFVKPFNFIGTNKTCVCDLQLSLLWTIKQDNTSSLHLFTFDMQQLICKLFKNVMPFKSILNTKYMYKKWIWSDVDIIRLLWL